MSGDEGSRAGLTLRAVELRGSDSVGEHVGFEVGERTTVLVGKNGAGKSVLLERLEDCLALVARRSLHLEEIDPTKFAAVLQVGGTLLRYQHEWSSVHIEEKPTLVRSCEQLGPTSSLLWQEDHAAEWVAAVNGDEIVRIASFTHRWATAPMAAEIENWAVSEVRISTYVRPHYRSAVFARAGFPSSGEPLARLVMRLHRWKEKSLGEFEELLAVGRRLELFESIQFIATTGGSQNFISAEVDGVNIGYLSDGTIRGLRIALELVDPKTKLLMIDEPESAVHPGLLRRLLHEIDAYSEERQIILATQSPQVVSWAHPASIRLVERKNGATTVRSLDAATLGRLDTYLHEGDTLGDFIYGGGIDDAAE